MVRFIRSERKRKDKERRLIVLLVIIKALRVWPGGQPGQPCVLVRDKIGHHLGNTSDWYSVQCLGFRDICQLVCRYISAATLKHIHRQQQ